MDTSSSLSWFQSTDNESLFQGVCTPANTLVFGVNASDIVFVDALLYTHLQILYTFVVIPIITALAVITNGSYLYVVAKVKSMQTVTNVYLYNVAVADMLFLLSTCAIYILFYFYSGGLFGQAPLIGYFECIGGLFPLIFYVQSLALMVAVTLDRYYAVCHPLKHRMFNKSRTIKIAIAAWVFGVLYHSKDLLHQVYRETFCVIWPDLPQYSDLPTIVGECHGPVGLEASIVIDCLADVLLFILAMSANCFMYFQIIQALNNRPAQRDGQQGLSDSADQTRRRVTRMLLANTLVFFILSVPNYITSLLVALREYVSVPFLDQADVAHTVIITDNILVAINSMVNPIVYNATNVRYREAYRQVFLPCRKTSGRQKAGRYKN